MRLDVIIRQLACLCGAGLMLWGTFLPMVGIPLFKDQNFWEAKLAGATIIAALALASIALALFKRFAWLYATGLASIGLLAYVVMTMNSQKAKAHQDLQAMADSPLRGLGNNFVSSINLRHGWVVMTLGSVVILAVAVLGPRLVAVRKKQAEIAPAAE